MHLVNVSTDAKGGAGNDVTYGVLVLNEKLVIPTQARNE